MTTSPSSYRDFRFPAEVIEHAVWLCHCFSLSLRDVELILEARGVMVSDKSIREWSLRFGRLFANALKRRRPKPGGKWHLDQVFIRIRGKVHYLWRAVNQNGVVLDILVQSRRSAKAAKRFFRKLLRGLQYVPRVLVTDRLRNYTAAKREVLPGGGHRQNRCLNNRAEVSCQPTRRRERQMQRFKSARHAQRFLSTHARIHNHFQLRRHRLTPTSIVPPAMPPSAPGARWSASRPRREDLIVNQLGNGAHPQPRCRLLSCGTDKARPEQVKLCSPVALALDQLEAGDLALDLAAAPGQHQGCAHGLLVLTQAGGEAAQLAVLGIGQPRGERIRRVGADQSTKAQGEVASRGQRWRQPQQPLDIGAVRICKRRQVSREHPGHPPRRVCRRPR